MNDKSIYYCGNIYEGVSGYQQASNLVVYDKGNDVNIKKYPVAGPHPFTEGQEVTGLYEVRYQFATCAVKDKPLWIDANEATAMSYSTNRQVAVALPTVQKNIECPVCNGQGWTVEAACCNKPHENGSCCNEPVPVQEECENCKATGRVPTENKSSVESKQEGEDWVKIYEEACKDLITDCLNGKPAKLISIKAVMDYMSHIKILIEQLTLSNKR